MAANLLARAGNDVHVLERASGPMDGRGAGIVTHSALVRGLVRCGMAPGFELGVRIPGRVTLDSEGRMLGQMDMPQVLTSCTLPARRHAAKRHTERRSGSGPHQRRRLRG